ncbi:hypothetical protein NDU88_003996 [Pleurodeles waltl]|uniref:Uncharacterized protein n=1 Tax=Pleurodeles waltl TaxID=8319 RepID=A0AAV7QGF5_PLEWA|nr:hypothetical protein NDU88_003996 [Pleurodeles waltl]
METADGGQVSVASMSQDYMCRTASITQHSRGSKGRFYTSLLGTDAAYNKSDLKSEGVSSTYLCQNVSVCSMEMFRDLAYKMKKCNLSLELRRRVLRHGLLYEECTKVEEQESNAARPKQVKSNKFPATQTETCLEGGSVYMLQPD